MDYHAPRMWKALLVLFLGCVSFGLGAALIEWVALWPFLIFGVVSVGLSIVETALLITQSRVDFYDAVSRFADVLREMTPDQRSALGIAFPSLRIRFTGEPLVYIEDTDITRDELESFLDGADIRQVCPERNWIAAGYHKQRYFVILDWLNENRWIYDASAAGNHSWLWRGSDTKNNIERMYVRELKELE